MTCSPSICCSASSHGNSAGTTGPVGMSRARSPSVPPRILHAIALFLWQVPHFLDSQDVVRGQFRGHGNEQGVAPHSRVETVRGVPGNPRLATLLLAHPRVVADHTGGFEDLEGWPCSPVMFKRPNRWRDGRKSGRGSAG